MCDPHTPLIGGGGDKCQVVLPTVLLLRFPLSSGERTFWNDADRFDYESLGLPCRNSLGWNEYKYLAEFRSDVLLQKPHQLSPVVSCPILLKGVNVPNVAAVRGGKLGTTQNKTVPL